MKYSISWLTEKIKAEQKVKFLFFWGHQPTSNGNITATCLSQWWYQPFIIEQIIYPTTEHWMMSQKALLFGDDEISKRIISAKTPGEAKDLGRRVHNFDQEIWEEHRTKIVVKGNLAKFGQNSNLKEFLLQTNDRVLVEASPVDYIWGIGMTSENSEAQNPERWNGLNLLGFSLMETRDILRQNITI